MTRNVITSKRRHSGGTSLKVEPRVPTGTVGNFRPPSLVRRCRERRHVNTSITVHLQRFPIPESEALATEFGVDLGELVLTQSTPHDASLYLVPQGSTGTQHSGLQGVRGTRGGNFRKTGVLGP